MRRVGPDGPKDARFGWVGMAPGKQEEEQGRPFVGPSGEFMNEAVGGEQVRASARVLNVRDWRPPDEQKPAQRAKEIREALPRLASDLAEMSECRSLLLVGDDALEATLGVDEIARYHGSQWSRNEVDSIRQAAMDRGLPIVECLPPKVHTVTAMYHPAFTMHGGIPQFRPMLARAARRAAMASRLERAPERPDGRWFDLMPEPRQVRERLEWADSVGEPVAFDVETDSETGESISIAGVRTGREVSVFRWVPAFIEVVREWLARPGVVVGHNLLFDLYALSAYGLGPGTERPEFRRKVWVDTIVAESQLRPAIGEAEKRKWFALPTCVMDAIPGVAYWKEAMPHPNPKKNKNRWATLATYRATWPDIPPELSIELYNALDNWWSRELWRVRRAELERAGML